MQTNVFDLVPRRGELAIVLGRRDHEALRRVVARARERVPSRLEEALRHAVVVPQLQLPDDVVSLGSTVLIESSAGHVRQVVVVEPWLGNGAPGFVSVLEPLGAALLGAAEGETVDVEEQGGSIASVRIVAVDPGGGAA